MQLENQVPDVEEKKSLLGKISYKFKGYEYKTREEAEQAREEEIIRTKKETEQNEVRKQIEEALEEKRKEYNAEPMYLSMPVACSYIPDMKQGFFRKYESNLAAYVDVDSLSEKIDIACRELYIRGYEVISITQAISGVGANTIWGKGTDKSAAAGWGYSFTNGAVITAKKR